MIEDATPPTANVLDLLRRQPGHLFCGIARLTPNATLVLSDEVPASMVGAFLGPLMSAGEPVWHSAKTLRLPTAWSLVLGQRPACIATCLLPAPS